MISRRILYVQYTDPAAYPPVEHSSLLLAKRGWEVVLLGASRRANRGLALPAHERRCVKTIRFVDAGWRQKLQYVAFFFWVLYWTRRRQPQWVYLSDPLSCPIMWWVRRFTGVQILYHEHDSPNSDQVHTWFMRQVLLYRKRIAREAELCVLPQQARLREFVKTTGRKRPTFCVWNCPRLDEIADWNSGQEHHQPDQKLTIYYHGSITPARLPFQLIIAASRFEGAVRVRVAGRETLGSIGYMAELMNLAARNGAADLVEFLGTMPRREDLLHLASGADVGLSLMPKQSTDLNLRHMVGASNKPFDYMASGLPLLVTDSLEWVATFVEPGYALACDPNDLSSIETALRWFLEHPDDRRQMGQKGKNKIQQSWNYDNMFAAIIDKLENS
jgi:glycosyltransferase involved in cell wall biosynthesis